MKIKVMCSTTIRYAFYGALFGLLFPVMSTLWELFAEQLPVTLENLLAVQMNSSLHLVIDTAPFFLGLFASFAGRRQEQLTRLNEQLAKERNQVTADSKALQTSLEEQMFERTEALAYRNIQLETAAQVSEVVGSLLGPGELEHQVVELIRQQFDHYYVGLFLVDESDEWTGEPGRWAVLRAGTGEAGRAMLEADHKVEIGGASMVGSCLAEGQARVELGVGEGTARFDNPLLPETRSEMALPLIARGRIIGAIAVQSEREAAFGQEDISILQMMAAQVANTLQNIRLFDQMQAALAEAEMLYNASRSITSAGDLQEIVAAVAEGVPVPAINRAVLLAVELDAAGEVAAFVSVADWHRGEESLPLLAGRRFPRSQLPYAHLILAAKPLFVEDIGDSEQIDPVTQALFTQQNVRAIVFLPLWVGGRQVGTLILAAEKTCRFTEVEIRLYRLLAGQMAVAVENRRLIEQTQATLAETQTLYEISRQLATTLDEREVLRHILSQIARVGAERVTVGFYEGPAGGLAEWFNVAAVYQPELGHQITIGRILPLNSVPAVRHAYERSLEGSTVFNDVASNPPADETLRADFAARHVQAFASIPMVWQGRPFAALIVERVGRTYFTESEINLYQAIAGQAAVAIQNARLFRQAKARASRLQAAGEVSRAASSILNPDELIQQAVNLIQERFDLYYVGLFLLDETSRWAVLRAGTGKAGRTQVEQNYKLDVGGESMIGWCMAHALARIVQDVAGEAAHYVNPLLPQTRSEMALPLISRGRVIGAMTIQDSREAAFSEEDVSVLQTMADQLASAIENASLFEQSQQALAEAEVASRHYQQREWQAFLGRQSAVQTLGFRDGPEGTMPISSAGSPEQKTGPLAGPDGDGDKGQQRLAVPIKLRRQAIGTIDLYREDDGREWSEDEQALAESLAEQLALAIENARLFEQTQYRARREQLMREITDRIRGKTDLDAILRTTVMELGKALGTSHAAIRLGTEAELGSPPAR